MPNAEGPRDTDGNLKEHVRPTNTLAMTDLARNFGETDPKVLLRDESREFGDYVEAVVDWGVFFNELQGTFISPEDFVSWFDVLPADITAMVELLKSNLISADGKPIVTLKKGANFVLNIFAGCNCQPAIAISNLGSQSNLQEEEDIGAYQTNLFAVSKHVLARTGHDARISLGLQDKRPVLIHDDDCGATIVTIGSSLRIIDKIIGLNHFSALQTNLGVATGHAVAMSAVESQRLNTPTELNVGWLCFGLTEGVGKQKAGKNYLANVQGIDSASKTGVFGVGDMGNASRKLRTLNSPWNNIRQDDYYERDTAHNVTWFRTPDSKSDLRIAFAMGGLLINSMRTASNGNNGTSDNFIMARASRKSNDGKFFAVFSDYIYALYKYGYQLVEQ